MNASQFDPNYSFEIKSVSYIGNPKPNTAMYVSAKVEKLISNLKDIRDCLVFTEKTIAVPAQAREFNCFMMVDNPQLSYADFANTLSAEKTEADKSRKYSLTDSGYYIGENVSVGCGSVIEPGCFIGHDVVIGKNSYIKAGAVIRDTEIGDNFIAGEGCTIGTSGFTMATDENGNKVRITTLGKVIIGDNVEICALSNVCCGSAGDTVICDNVKIDSLVHIGHDAWLGINVEIPAGAIVGGFVHIDEGAYVGINATLRNRIDIGRNAFVGMGAVVTKSVAPGTTVVGNPAKPFERK